MPQKRGEVLGYPYQKQEVQPNNVNRRKEKRSGKYNVEHLSNTGEGTTADRDSPRVAKKQGKEGVTGDHTWPKRGVETKKDHEVVKRYTEIGLNLTGCQPLPTWDREKKKLGVPNDIGKGNSKRE